MPVDMGATIACWHKAIRSGSVILERRYALRVHPHIEVITRLDSCSLDRSARSFNGEGWIGVKTDAELLSSKQALILIERDLLPKGYERLF